MTRLTIEKLKAIFSRKHRVGTTQFLLFTHRNISPNEFWQKFKSWDKINRPMAEGDGLTHECNFVVFLEHKRNDIFIGCLGDCIKNDIPRSVQELAKCETTELVSYMDNLKQFISILPTANRAIETLKERLINHYNNQLTLNPIVIALFKRDMEKYVSICGKNLADLESLIFNSLKHVTENDAYLSEKDFDAVIELLMNNNHRNKLSTIGNKKALIPKGIDPEYMEECLQFHNKYEQELIAKAAVIKQELFGNSVYTV